MKIEVKEVIEITLNRLWDRDLYDTINESDIIMYRGDTYQVIEIKTECKSLDKILILYRISRASNYYVINRNGITKVADYDKNCKKDGR